MNVTVAEEDKLRRKLSVEVPLSDVESVYQEVYGRLRANIHVAGFRPGRYPRHLAEKRFKEAMAGEAMQSLVPRYYERALGELELRPATEPKFDNLDIDKARPFKFEVEFEVVPTFKMVPATQFKLKAEQAKVADKDVEARIEELRNSRAAYEDKGDAPAAKGDVVTFDFLGTLDGEPFEGGSGEGQKIEVGSTQYLPEFDAQFDGIKPGDSRTFPLTFPAEYPEASLAGREVQFEVTAHSVEKRVPPPLDKDFFAQFGEHETEQDFREGLKNQLLAEKERDIQTRYGEELTLQIGKAYDFDVPEMLIEQNLHEFEHQLTHENPDALKDEQELAKLKKAERDKIENNLRVAYVLDALAREHEIAAEKEEVTQRFFMQAYMMRQNPSELIETPHGRQMLAQIEQGIVTNKTLELLAGQVLEGGKGGKAAKDKEAHQDGGQEARPAKKKAAKAKDKPDKSAKTAKAAAGKSGDKAKADKVKE